LKNIPHNYPLTSAKLSTSMNAVIMAGGFGTRLRPLTANIPKPMVPMLNKPMMHHIVTLLRQHGFTDIVATLFYQPDVIKNYFANGREFSVNMTYVQADVDYGTAGSVRNAAEHLKNRFLVISGDVLTDINLTNVLVFHRERDAKVTIVLTRAHNPLQYGVVVTRDDGRIVRFLEKPSWGEVFSDTINTGIYVIEPEILELIPYRQEFDFSKNLFPLLLESGAELYGYVTDRYWRDVGNLDEYQQAHFDGLAGEVKIQIEGSQQGTVYIGDGTVVNTDERNLQGNVLLGKNCRIEKGVRIVNSVIGDHCIVEAGAVIRNCVLWDHAVVGRNAELSFDIVGSQCVIGDEATILDNVYMSDKCSIGKGARVLPNIKLWPGKTVEDRAVLNRSLVWEDRWLRELFADARITGLSNLEMNPEFGAKLGAAWGAFLGTGKTVAASRDADNVSRMMNRAIICGLVSAGVNVNDLRAMSIPLVRHELHSGKEAGGVHVRKSPYDKRMTDIIFFDANGKDLPVNKTKAIERLFFGEDFLRSPAESVGTISFPERTTETYREQFLSALDLDTIRQAKFKIVIDYSNGVAAAIFPAILGAFDCQVLVLNSHLDPKRLTRDSLDLGSSLRQLSHIVTSLKYDLGCMVDVVGERITVVDEEGNIIDSDRLLTLVTKLFLHLYPDTKKIAVPITSSVEVDVLAREYRVGVVKTRNTHLAMMEAASDKDVGFVGGTKGGFIFTDFFFASDGMFSLAKILEMMAKTGLHLGALDGQLPRLYRVKKEVRCPWDTKGKIMRYVMRETERQHRELVDGVRLLFDGTETGAVSVMLLPDKEQPLFHITAEGSTREAAMQLAEKYEQQVIRWRDN
jgi:mannose-1-phosphate guanylyltransferase/phosphomannomutase